MDHTFDPKAAHPTIGAGDFCLITALPLDAVCTHLQGAGVVVELGPVARRRSRAGR